MDKTALLELLLAGFFAVGCIRAHAPLQEGSKAHFTAFFRLTGRIERLRRSRWQWFSIVLIMLVLRLQHQLPVGVEIMAAVLFVIFLAIPAQAMAIVAR
jgi:uncharacterized membrane protein YhaH (DUF805 family)